MSRALRRHHRERLIRQVGGFGEWYAERAHKLYNTRKFCSCVVTGCGNPRRLLRGREWLTVQERRQEERARYEREEELSQHKPLTEEREMRSRS